MKVFGERIKSALKDHGLTQRWLCGVINVQPSTLCEWLNDHNEPPMQTIVDIARALDVTTDFLLGLEDY